MKSILYAIMLILLMITTVDSKSCDTEKAPFHFIDGNGNPKYDVYYFGYGYLLKDAKGNIKYLVTDSGTVTDVYGYFVGCLNVD